jgi:maleate cis-trans isomerase
MEPDFQRWLPQGITAHAQRVGRSKMVTTLDVVGGELVPNSLAAAEVLAHAWPDVVIFGCTSATVSQGAGAERQMAENITERTGVPTITTATAVLEAMRAMGLKRITMLTPYINEINEVEVKFFEDYGFEMLAWKGMEISESRGIPRVTPQQIYEFARRHTDPKSDGLFISCTNFRAGEVVPLLEQDLGIPVISSNTACLWAALRSIGMQDATLGAGRLLTEHTAPRAF